MRSAVTIAVLMILLSGCNLDDNSTSESVGSSDDVSLDAPESLSAKTVNRVVTLTWPIDDSIDSYHVYYSEVSNMDIEFYGSFEGGTWLQDVRPPFEIDFSESNPEPIYHFYLTKVRGNDESPPSDPAIAAPRYEVLESNPSEVIDHANSLIWDRCVYGQAWNETLGKCEGNGERIFHVEARDFLNESDFRRPKLSEIASLFYCREDDPPYFAIAKDDRHQSGGTSANGCSNLDAALYEPVFPNTPTDASYWTSTEYVSDGTAITRVANVESGSWGLGASRHNAWLYLMSVRDK